MPTRHEASFLEGASLEGKPHGQHRDEKTPKHGTSNNTHTTILVDFVWIHGLEEPTQFLFVAVEAIPN